jgi:hypothetical protein
LAVKIIVFPLKSLHRNKSNHAPDKTNALVCFRKRKQTRAQKRAGNETRTRDFQLGKLTLYRLSYAREAADGV